MTNGQVCTREDLEIVTKGKIQEKYWVSSIGCTNQRCNDQLLLKQISIKRKRIARVGWLCGERDTTINHIVNESSKLALKIQDEAQLGEKGDPVEKIEF